MPLPTTGAGTYKAVGGGLPPGITNLIGWWDASVTASIALSGSNVVSWADQSGAGNDLTAANNPTYSATSFNSNTKPGITMASSGSGLTKNNFAFGTGNTLTVFFVGQFNKAFSTEGRAISYSAGPGYTGVSGSTTDEDNNFSFALAQQSNGDNVYLYRNGSSAARSFPGDLTPHRCIATIDSSGVMTIYIDNVATTGSTLNTAFASTPSQLQIGNVSSTPGNAKWNGVVAECGVSTAFTSSTNVATLDNYLKTKWGMGGSGPVTWTPTDAQIDAAAGFVNSKTFATVNIGTATATRQVIVVMSCANAAAHPQTFTCTVGAIAATLIQTANSDGGSAGVDVAIFQANVTVGTTASVTITATDGFSNNDIQAIAIGVGALDGVNPAPTGTATPGLSTGGGGSPYPTGGSVTVPTGGIVIGAAGCSNSPGTPGWGNITADATSTIAGVNQAVSVGHITTTGAITPSAIFGNFAHCVTLAVAWGP
jgi:hypothetical protein